MSPPRFNHVAMSLPSAMLDDAGRADIVRFYNDVFGWEEMPTMTDPGKRLVLQAYSYDQFVYLLAEDEPMRCPRLDHFGMSVASQEEFDTYCARAEAAAAADDRVDFIGHEVEEFGDFLRLHNFYVGFLLPMMIEVQFFDWAEGMAPESGGA